ncbi:hypothetical protein JCM8208_004921 [Rhodotorula glutinis]
MSDKLDDDVLLAILEHIAEPAFSQRGYRTRQSTLLSACLASRHLHRLAEPLLLRQVRFRSVEQLEQLREHVTATSSGDRTEVYVVRWQERVSHAEVALDVAAFLPRIERMELGGMFQSFLPLERHTQLRRLSLWLVELPNLLPTLPQLEQLAIRDCPVPKLFFKLWLDPSHLPRLRALLLCGVRAPFQFIPLNSLLSPSILAQLDLVQTDDRSLGAHDPLAWSDEPPCLCYHGPRSDAVVRYNLYGPTSVDAPSATRATRCAVDAGVAREQGHASGPFAFVFPASGIDHKVELGVLQLEEQGMRVLFDHGDSHEPQSSELVSGVFWRLARELKAERVRREQEGRE